MSANNDVGTDGMTGGFQYDAYGRIVRAGDGGADSDSSDFGWLYLHQSGAWDDDELSALYQFRCHDFSPSLGRWVQHDAVGHVDGLSLYEYVQPRR